MVQLWDCDSLMIMMHGDHQHQSSSIVNACSVILLIMMPKSQLLQIDATEIDCMDEYRLSAEW